MNCNYHGQGCLLVDSHKSTGSGPVRSPAEVSQQETKKKHNQKQKRTKQTKNTQPQPNQNKQNTEKWDRCQQWE